VNCVPIGEHSASHNRGEVECLLGSPEAR